ncbi:MAG: MATE family efflux transporter, partial [Thalassolituus sp.]
LAVVPLLALSSSIGGIVGQNWGAGYGDRARRALGFALLFCLGYSLVAGVLLVIWREPLASIFTDSPEVIEALSSYLLISVWGYAGFGAIIVVNGAFNAIDRAYWALGQSVVRVALIMIPVAIGLSMVLESRSIYAAELIANLVGGIGAVILGRALLDDRWLAR